MFGPFNSKIVALDQLVVRLSSRAGRLKYWHVTNLAEAVGFEQSVAHAFVGLTLIERCERITRHLSTQTDPCTSAGIEADGRRLTSRLFQPRSINSRSSRIGGAADMARRRELLADTLLMLPWWVSAVVAATAYVLLEIAAPRYFAASPYSAGFGIAAKNLAPFVAGLFLFIGLLSFIRALVIKRKFNNLTSIEEVRQLTWRQFESIVGEAFRRRGYRVKENVVDGPDGGIDLVLQKDGAKFYVQCKQWKQTKVGVKSIRELYGVIAAGDAAGGFFVASGEYTEEAREFALKCAIELIDGPVLAEMIAQAREPEPFIDPTNRKRIEPTIVLSIADPACPTCGGSMVRRTAKRGTHAGREFWGCSLYPRCRGTRSAE